jgi:hypothetical protein
VPQLVTFKLRAAHDARLSLLHRNFSLTGLLPVPALHVISLELALQARCVSRIERLKYTKSFYSLLLHCHLGSKFPKPKTGLNVGDEFACYTCNTSFVIGKSQEKQRAKFTNREYGLERRLRATSNDAKREVVRSFHDG